MEMKMKAAPAVQLDEQLLQEIKQEVKETLAVEMVLPVKKERMFTSADLWNVRRQRRSFARRNW